MAIVYSVWTAISSIPLSEPECFFPPPFGPPARSEAPSCRYWSANLTSSVERLLLPSSLLSNTKPRRHKSFGRGEIGDVRNLYLILFTPALLKTGPPLSRATGPRCGAQEAS